MIKKAKKVGLVWFANDLRLHDNPALSRASEMVDELVCVYVVDRPWQDSSLYSSADLAEPAERFLNESLIDLDGQLEELEQKLFVLKASAKTCINKLIAKFHITDVFRSVHAGWYEGYTWQALKDENSNVGFHSFDTHTLFEREQLPFRLKDLPATFTKFRKAVSQDEISRPISIVDSLPPLPANFDQLTDASHNVNQYDPNSDFQGGEQAGLGHMEGYFSTAKASNYKQVRNEIDGWDNSTKFSPWLANGCLSARQLMAELNEYEARHGSNDSTYWIYFELLWREYFQWYAHNFGVHLFSFGGIKKRTPLTSFYPERFRKWVNGSTPYSLVNACMNELKSTGFLSNRGRQIVASCLVNELSMDWRYGAAYFEQALIDYDVASNWGNWQYLAGVGADVQNKRHFNLDKQTQIFDPERRYIRLWNADAQAAPLDSVDAADWPIS